MPEQTTSKVLTFNVTKKLKTPFMQKPSRFSGLESNIHQRIVRATSQIINKEYLFKANDDPESPVDCTVNTGQPYTLDLLSDESLPLYQSYQFNFDEDEGKLEKTICDRDQFCCNFTVEYQKPKAESLSYRAVVFNGVRNYGVSATAGVQLCSIVVCAGSDLENCTSRLENKDFGYVFNKIQITGDFLKVNASQFPDTLTDGDYLLPLSNDDFEFFTHSSNDDDVNSVTLELKSPQNTLVTFGIYGRVFSRDGEEATRNFANVNLQNLFLTLLSAFAVEFLRRIDVV